MGADLDICAWALIAGAGLFFVGAGLPPEPSRVFAADRDEYLAILNRHRTRWRWMNVCMAAGVATTAAGLVGVALLWREPFGLGATAYALGAVLWIGALLVRATVELDVAAAMANGTPVPDWFTPLQRATGAGFVAYLLLAYAGLVAAGIALVLDGPAVAGWFAIGFGALAFLANATGYPTTRLWGPVFEPPFMAHIPPLVIGIALLGWKG